MTLLEELAAVVAQLEAKSVDYALEVAAGRPQDALDIQSLEELDR